MCLGGGGGVGGVCGVLKGLNCMVQWSVILSLAFWDLVLRGDLLGCVVSEEISSLFSASISQCFISCLFTAR